MKTLKLNLASLVLYIIGTIWFAFVIFELLTGHTFGTK